MDPRNVSEISGAGLAPALATLIIAVAVVLVIGYIVGRLFRRTRDTPKSEYLTSRSSLFLRWSVFRARESADSARVHTRLPFARATARLSYAK